VTDVDSAHKFGAHDGALHSFPTRRSSDLGAWTYTMSSAQDQLTAGQVVTETFTVASADGTSKPAAVTVTITGTNDAAVISTDARAEKESNEAQAVNGTVTVTQVE